MRHDYDNFSGVNPTHKIFYWGRVVNITDEFESRRIKVYIPEIDSKLGDFENFKLENKNIRNLSDSSDSLVKKLPECYPLIPAYFHYVPQIGERVLVFMDRYHDTIKEGQQEKRYYLTVSTSQPQRIEFDPYDTTADSLETDGKTKLENPISRIPTAKGAYPKKDEVGLIGKKNSDVLLKDSEVILRAGKHEKKNPTVFNRRDIGFIQVKNSSTASKETKKTKTVETQIIPPDVSINVSVIDYLNSSGNYNTSNVIINVVELRTNDILVRFEKSYGSRDLAIKEAKTQISNYQKTYKQWKLELFGDNIESDLGSLPKMFPNNTRNVTKEVELKDKNENVNTGSVANIVADKINLLSHKSAKNFNLTDPEKHITDEEQQKINTEAHPMVKGDILKNFLDLVKLFAEVHTHPYHGVKTDPDEILQKIKAFNLDDILDKNIRLG